MTTKVNLDPPRPGDVDDALKRAERLEWQTLFWLVVIVAVMGLVAGGSQAFRTAWIEDMLSLLAPSLFLISRKVEQMPARDGFPSGFHRAGSLAFFFSAAALSAIGAFLLWEGGKTLVLAEHPTVGSIRLFGHTVWLGWLMIAALIFSVIPPVILGRRKIKIARRLSDKVLYTDAETNAADWQTGLAGVAGILGLAFGLWWADAAMAVLISISVLKDGLQGLRIATVSLLDGAPRKLDSMEIDPDAHSIVHSLRERYRGARIQVRETGRYFRVNVEPEDEPHLPPDMADSLMRDASWRLIEVSIAVRGGWPEEGEDREPKT